MDTTIPRRLVIYNEKGKAWSPSTDESILASIEYLAVSYRESDFPNKTELEAIIRLVCYIYQLNAYWIDYACTSSTLEEKSKDLFLVADVFRRAKKTLIIVADTDEGAPTVTTGWLRWNDRFWSLLEVLLSQQLSYQVGTKFVRSTDLRWLADLVYENSEEKMLIDHFLGTDTLPLKRLVMLLQRAIWRRSESNGEGGVFKSFQAERVYALMGFLPTKITPYQKESEDAAFARLMKANKLVGIRISRDISIQRTDSPVSQDVETPNSSYLSQDTTLDELNDSLSNIDPSEDRSEKTELSSSGKHSEFDVIIANRRKALELMSEIDPEQKARLHSKLALSLENRYQKTRDIKDLDEAIVNEEETIQLTPDGHEDKARYYDNLGISYQRRYDRQKHIEDVDKAIANKSNAAHLVDKKNSEKASYLSNLGNSLQCRFEKSGDPADIERSIDVNREAIRLATEDYYNRRRFLGNLAIALYCRYEKSGSFDDLDEAIQIRRDMMKIIEDKQKKLDHWTKLSINLHHRYNKRKDLHDISEAIELRKEVVELASDQDADKTRYLDNLALALRARYDKEKDINDLHQTITYREQAVQLAKDSSSRKPDYLDKLAYSLSTRFDKLHDIVDINRAIAYQKEAIRLAPDSHRNKVDFIDSLEKFIYKRP